MSCTKLESIIETFEKFTQKPVNYLNVQLDAREDHKNLVKSVYDFTKGEEKILNCSKSDALPKLIVKEFNEEQIWQQIELQNNGCWEQLINDVATCMTVKGGLQFPITIGDNKKQDETETKDSDDQESIENEEKEDESTKPDLDRKIKKSKKKQLLKPQMGKKTIVDDDFFKLNEMEHFLLSEERKDGKKVLKDSDEESIDFFEADEDDELEGLEDRQDAMYDEFFEEQNDEDNRNHDESGEDENSDNFEEEMNNSNGRENAVKSKKQVRFASTEAASSSDDNDSEVENSTILERKPSEKQSDFEQRQERLKQTISRLENKSLTDAPWQLKGEVDATKRPQNSLLQEVVDFDLTSRPPPIITEETTVTLEELIRRRIKDKAWDDVVRKVKPVNDVLAFKKPEILDQSKSKMSLAQVYEAEYLKQKHGEAEEKEPEAHTVIRNSMSKLFAQLDALSHYHYTPKPAQPEVKIVSNTPAINMEEVAPIAMSNAALLAPEEVKKKNKGDLISKEERTNTDKNRERRKKKKLQKEKAKMGQDFGKPKKIEEKKESNKSLKTSKAFFEHLNQDVNSLIRPGKLAKRKSKGQ